MGLPEEIRSLSCQKLVVHVIAVGHGKWWVLGEHDEEDDTAGKEVDNLSLIWGLIENLRSHVSWSSDDRSIESASITTLKWACESEINDLDVVIFVEKDVFWLQITVA